MKNKILLAIALVIGVSVCVFYYSNQNKAPEDNIIEENITQEEGKIVTDDFEMNIPEGWESVPDLSMGTSAMAVNKNEKNNDSAEAINFKSYMAVSHENLDGKNLEAYMQDIKNALNQLITEKISFGNENDVIVNDRNAKALDLEMTQQGVDFKVLIVAIEGDNDDVWAISFNTAKDNWSLYEEEFASAVKSFNIKK